MRTTIALLALALAACGTNAIAFDCNASSNGNAVVLDDAGGTQLVATCDGQAWELARCDDAGDNCVAQSLSPAH